MNNDNPFPSSRIASRSAEFLTSVSSATVAVHSESLTSRASSAVETIASVSSGQTVFVTVTKDSSTPTSPAPTQASELGRKSSAPVGAIAGGVAGGVVALALVVIVLIVFWRKRQAKENRRATLPPPYADADMSGQIGGAAVTPTASDNTAERKTVAVEDEKASISNEVVQQLDSTPIVPTTEMGGDPLGNIAELPASDHDADPFATPGSSTNSSIQPGTGRLRAGEADNHVMSWVQFNSLGNRNPASRLSQPHGVPDSSTGMWENLSPVKTTQDERDGLKKGVED